jgi:hypothetical protein
VRRRVVLVAALAAAALSRDARGQLVGAFRVNSYITSNQNNSKVSMRADGTFVVAWQSKEGPGGLGYYQIIARRFSRGGSFLTDDVLVSSVTSKDEDHPAIAVVPNGFVVVWHGAEFFGTIYGRRLDARANLVSSQFKVSTTTATTQNYPSVAADASGNFVVVWQGVDAASSTWDVFAQRYAASGSAVGGQFRVNTYSTGDQKFPAVAAAPTGEFLVVWQSPRDGDGNGIYGQLYDASGAPAGIEFRVNTNTTDDQVHPAIAADGHGNFVVAWAQYSTNVFRTSIRARRFTVSGAPIGGELTPLVLAAAAPSVAVDPFGNFVVAWSELRYTTQDVFARRYRHDGAAAGTELLVTSYTTGNQIEPTVAYSYDHFVVVWTDISAAASSPDIFGALYTPGPQGDVDGDGAVGVADVFYLINYLFAGGPAPFGASDVNGDGALDVLDVFYLINYLFAGGQPPA